MGKLYGTGIFALNVKRGKKRKMLPSFLTHAIFRQIAKWKGNKVREILAITKALADESRLRALYALKTGELCLCQIVELLRLAPSTVSKHMAILRRARLIDGRKEGRWIFYRLMGAAVPGEIQEGIDWICGGLTKTKRIQEDSRRLKKILSINREELCKRHRCPKQSGEKFLRLKKRSKRACEGR